MDTSPRPSGAQRPRVSTHRTWKRNHVGRCDACLLPHAACLSPLAPFSYGRGEAQNTCSLPLTCAQVCANVHVLQQELTGSLTGIIESFNVTTNRWIFACVVLVCILVRIAPKTFCYRAENTQPLSLQLHLQATAMARFQNALAPHSAALPRLLARLLLRWAR